MTPPDHVMHISVDDGPEERVAEVSGTLDVFSSAMLPMRALAGLPDTARSIVIDLRDVVFVDSAGVSALKKVGHDAKARALEVHTLIGGTQSKINTTVIDVIRRVLPCDD